MVLQGSDFVSKLQELWYGNIQPSADQAITDKEKKLIQLIALLIEC